MPFWAQKDFFMRNFGWVRNNPEVLAGKHKGRLLPHLMDALGRIRVKASTDFHLYMRDKEPLWTILRVLEDTGSALLTAVTIGCILAAFILKKI